MSDFLSGDNSLPGLLSRMFDDALSDNEFDQLASLLETDSSAREFYLAYLAFDAELDNRLASARPLPAGIATKQPPFDFSELESLDLRTVPTQDSDRSKILRSSPILNFLSGMRSVLGSPVVWSVAVVAILTYGSFIFIAWNIQPGRLPLGVPDNNLSVAVVSSTSDVRWSRETASKVSNSPIHSGELLTISSGTIELELKSGAKLVVEGPADWSVDGKNSVSLRAGKLMARVPQQAIGFTVETPTAKVVDLGTEFGVSVDQGGTTEAQVFRGAIEIETLAKGTQPARQDKQRRMLVAGEAARVDVTASTLRIEPIATKPGQSERQFSTVSKQQDHEPSGYAKSVIERTAPVLYWNFDNPLRYLTRDLVQGRAADHFSPAADGMKGPRPVDGFANMNVDNRALYVKKSHGVTCNERVAPLGISVDAYSMQMWFMSAIVFDGQGIHTLFGRGNTTPLDAELRDAVSVGGSYGRGSEPGRLYFIAGQSDFDGKNSPGISMPGATTLQPQTWYHVVMVRDGDAVRIYLNGKLEISTRSPWLGGNGSCFTFGNRVDQAAARGFGLNGYFDEVSIWNRALEYNEVLTTYRLATEKELEIKQ